MTKVEADALLDAFLAAKAAGQEELWRETHPEDPDGATVLSVWLFTNRSHIPSISDFIRAFTAVDTRCALRMAIYAAIAAHPTCSNYFYKSAKGHLRMHRLGKAIGAAIAYYNSPTVENRLAADAAADAAQTYSAVAANVSDAYHAHISIFTAARATDLSKDFAPWAAINAMDALGDAKVVDVLIAAVADHYEGRPLEMP